MRTFNVYPRSSTDIGDKPKGSINDALEATVSRTVDGEYTAMLKVPYSRVNFATLSEGSVLWFPVSPKHKSYQPFRINSVSPAFSDGDFSLSIDLNHISYDLNFYPAIPMETEYTGASNAIQGIARCSVLTLSPFVLSTTLVDTTKKFKIGEARSIRAMIGDGDESFISVFKGEADFDGFTVNIQEKIGEETSLIFNLIGNIASSNETYDYSEMVTGIFPYWKDSDGKAAWIPASSTYDRIIPTGTFDYNKVGVVDLSSEFEKRPSAAQLHDKAVEYVAKHNLANPKITIEAAAYTPGDNASRQFYRFISENSLQLGDRFTYHNTFTGIDKRVRFVGYEYDVLNDIYTSTTIDSDYDKASDTISGLQSTVSQLASSAISNHNWSDISISATGGTMSSGTVLQVNPSVGFARFYGKFVTSSAISGTYGTKRIATFPIAFAPPFPVPIEMWAATGIDDTDIYNGVASNALNYNAVKGIVAKLNTTESGAISVYNYSGKNIPSGAAIYFYGMWPYQ